MASIMKVSEENEDQCGDSNQFYKSDMEYQQRVQRLQYYVPFLKKMIEHLEGAKDKNREAQLMKMRSLLNIITDSNKKLKLETIQRCEEVLQKLYSKVEGAFEWSTGFPNVHTKICIEIDKFNPEREEIGNYNRNSPLIESPDISSRDGDSMNNFWKRNRKTARDFFEETPRSPSPPASPEMNDALTPVMIPMERKEESQGSKPVIIPLERKELPEPKVIPLERQEESLISKPLFIRKEPKISRPLPMPFEHEDTFESRWYKGDVRSQEISRPMNNFALSNSSHPSEKEVGLYSGNLQQPSFSRDILPQASIPNRGSNNIPDVSKLDEMCSTMKKDGGEYQGYDKNLHIPFFDGGERWSKDDFERRPSKDSTFEGRKTPLGIIHQTESPRFVGSATLFDYGHGQNSPCADSSENTRESSIESEAEKNKLTSKSGNMQRVSLREKLALEINKVHRVGVSSGGALRSLCKDLGSPPHQRKVENREGVQNRSSERRLSDPRTFSEEGFQTHTEMHSLKQSDFKDTDSLSSSKHTDNLETENSKSSSHDKSIKESFSFPLDKSISRNVNAESPAHEKDKDLNVIEEFSFRKKRLDQNAEGKGYVTLSDDEDKSSKMSICDDDSDTGSKIPFLDLTELPPPRDAPSFAVQSIPPLMGTDPRYISSQCLSSAPQRNIKPQLQPFINPSNPNMNLSQGNKEDSVQPRNWSSQGIVSGRVGPQGYQPSLLQHKVNPASINASGHIVQHNINPSSHMVQPNVASPNQVSVMESTNRGQSQYMDMGMHPSHNLPVSKPNQSIRPRGKVALLPDPVTGFRHGQTPAGGHWSSMQKSDRYGLLPHPLQQQSWRNDSYSRPNISQSGAEYRHSSEGRGSRGRGGWNSRRGGFPKVNDPRLRKSEHLRGFSASSTDNKYKWKHPADPRRASPVSKESKHPKQPVPKEKSVQKETEEVSSPLNSLYDSEQAPKTGKGYGFQKFRIPKIKSAEQSKNITHSKNVPPPGEVQKEKDVIENPPQDKMEETKKEELAKTKEEITKGLFETLFKMSLSTGEETKILENLKFIEELREKFNLNRSKKTRPIIESDSESDEEEVKPSNAVSKGKKRSRLIIESSDSEKSTEEKDDMAKSVKKSPIKTPTSARRTPRSCRLTNQTPNTDSPGGRPRTRSQRKLFSVEEEDEKKEKNEEEMEDLVHDDVFLNEEKETEKHDEDQNNDEDHNQDDEQSHEDIKTKTAARRTKRRSSLELLQEDIREMFICEGVMSATGVRMCRLLKEAASVSHSNEDLSFEADASRNLGDWDEKSNASGKEDTSVDQSEDSFEEVIRTSRKQGNKKDEVTPPSSLQPRVVLKKAEINLDKKILETVQNSRRGRALARRSRKKPLNIGDRVASNSIHLSGDKVSGAEDEPEENVTNQPFKEVGSQENYKNDFGTINEVSSSTLDSHDGSFRESENASKSDDSGSNSTAKKLESCERTKFDTVGESLAKKDSLQNKSVINAEKRNDERDCSDIHEKSSDIEIVSTSNGKENKQVTKDVIDKSMTFVNEEKMGVPDNKGNVKKQKLKKKAKVNRRWALGILKKAVNHKRRSFTCLPTSSAQSTQYTGESLADFNQSIDLTDINYFCNGSENLRCKLCSYQGKQIVGHYVTKHPESEVLVSRLSSEQAKIAWDWTEANKGALKNAKLALTSSGPFVCLICEMWHTDYMEFYDHVTTHTGEYRYNCKTCSYRSFRGNNVRSHSYYIHHKKWCENSDCFTVSSVEPFIHKREEEDEGSGSLSSVIPGLVAHLCSKCRYIQISEKRLEDHVKNMHKEEDMPKVLKIDLSVIAPESSSTSNEQFESNSLPQDSFEASSDICNDEANSMYSCDNSFSSEKEKSVEEKTEVLKTEENIKKEEESFEDVNVNNELDSGVFYINDNIICESELIDRSKDVWLEVQDTPEFDDEVSIIGVKLNIKLKKDEEKKWSISESYIGNITDEKEEEVKGGLPLQSFDEKGETETASSNLEKGDDVSKAVVGEEKESIGRDNDAESHVSEVEIIEINDDSENSSDSESSYTDSSSSENEGIINSIGNPNKENLFALEMLPDVKVRTNLVDLTNKISHSIKNNVIEIDSVSLSEEPNSKSCENIEEENVEEAQEPLLDVNESSFAECDPLAEKPQKFKIRVRCLSGDLLSSTKENSPEDSLISSEQDPYIDVMGTSPVFKPDAENTLCQISSVCSLHPNEKVPEDFIKAVSENETPDLKTLAAYSPTPSPAPVYFLASSNFSPSQPIPNICSPLVLVPDKSKTSRVHRPILPKPVIPNVYLKDISGSPSKESTLTLQDTSNGKDFPNDIQTLPKKNLFGDASLASTACHSSTQPKVCSIMRASLYAKASKTPLVFNQVMNNQMKLCHLFKCMGRQCSFTTDEPMVFHSHYLGHESLESGAVSSTGGSSGENVEKQERKFDWQQCCYCAEMFSSANDYVKHVQTEHGECIYQCPYCFYRAAAVSYVILHQNSTHITEKVSVLHCKAPGKGTAMNKDSSPTKPNIEAYICYQGNCKRSFYSPTKYLSHLQLEHSACSIYCCHKCSFQCLKADRLLQHYKLHSFYLYQCVYCEQGSDTSEEILQHLASFHPNKRATVCKRNSQVNSNGSARTTGRHVYILYEDIELTEMDDVDVVPVENLASKNLVTSSPVKSNESIDKKTDEEHCQNETDLNFDDGNSDYEDDDNLIIAEDPEEITANTIQSTMEEDSEIVEIEEISTDVVVDDPSCSDVNEDPSTTDKNKERVESKKVIVPQESEVLIPLKIQNKVVESFTKKKLNDFANRTQISKVNDTSISFISDDEIIEIDSDKTKASVNDSELMEVSMEANVRNADNDVGNNESKTRMSTSKKLPSISKREDYRRRSSSLLQDEQSFKNKIKDTNSNLSMSKKNISLKESANSKIDRANLYQCCFSNCPFLGKDSNHLKHHVKTCLFSTDQVKYECPHCKRIYKHLPSLLKHYRMHSKKSFVCMICKYQGSHASSAVQHVKSKHRATSATVSPLTDWQEPDDIPLTSKDHKLIVVAPKEVSMSFLLRKRFLPEDADYLPLPCIYNREAKCARCSYSTKIRSNMRRHLHLHLKFNQGGRELFSNANSLGSNQVPWSDKDFVNPMPCLESKEMMFDKMTNWAMSSHLDENVKEEEVSEGRRDSTISNYEEDNFIPRFVPENERYVCGVIGCHYQTVDDMMLRHHLRALHREENTFRCAHCPDDPTIIPQVPVDRLAAHLKMHDDRLYQCIHCNYFHFQRRFVERHTLDKHSDLGQEVNVIREPDTFARASTSAGTSGMAGTSTDGSIRSSNPANDSVKSEEENLWHCGLCSYSCTNRESISDHARISHSISSQYLCGMCSFRSAYLTSFSSHFSSKHPGYPVQLIANYFRHNISVLASPSITIILPNGKVIHPPGPQSSKSDPRSEPVIEVWPFVEKGFGKSSSSSVRLKELNTTYPWQRCMPRVRYIRGIPIADEGEETMYDLSESLKVKEADSKPEQPVEEESGKSSQENNSEKEKVVDPVIKDEVTIVEIEDSDMTVTEPSNDVCVKKSLKRRQSDSDASKSESCSPEKKKADNVRSGSAIKDFMSKKSCDRIISGHQNVVKIPKLEPSIINVNSNESKEAASETVEDKAILKGLIEDKDFIGKVNDEKLEYLLFQYGKFGKPDQNLFVCPKCQKYKTKYKADMKEHLFRELNYKRFVCTHCGLMSPTKSRLQKHYVRVHQKDGKPEAIATLPPDEDIEIWVHFTLTTQLKIMKEPNKLKTNGPDEVEGMLDAVSTDFTSPSDDNTTCKNQYRCKHCPSKFSTVRGLKIHIKIYHLKLGSWICGHCDVTANAQVIISKHSKSAHPDKEELVINNSLGSFTNSKFWQDYGLFESQELPAIEPTESVMEYSSDCLPLKCSLCNYETEQRDEFTQHERQHSSVKPYICGSCDYCADQESDIKSHFVNSHPFISPKVLSKLPPITSELKQLQSCEDKYGIANQTNFNEEDSSRQACDDVEVVEQNFSEGETLITMDNIGECENPNLAFVFKCYYCRMRSSSCSDVLNHWENVHHNLSLPSRKLRPFKCKKMTMKKVLQENQDKTISAGQDQIYHCAYCQESGRILHLKEHFTSVHPESDFKVGNVSYTSFHCSECNYMSCSLAVLADHFEVSHPSKNFQYEVKSENASRKNLEDNLSMTLGGNLEETKNANEILEGVTEEFLKGSIYRCYWCNEEFLTLKTVKNHHFQKHTHSPLKYLIEVKMNKIDKNAVLPKSLVNKNVVKTYHCPSCPIKMKSLPNIFEHLRIHTLPFKCGTCGFAAEVPSRILDHHIKEHPHIPSPVINPDLNAENEMSKLWKKIKVTEEPAGTNTGGMPFKRRAVSPLLHTPKKHCPVARKSTTQVFPPRSTWKATARKSTNSSPLFIKKLKGLTESSKAVSDLSSEISSLKESVSNVSVERGSETNKNEEYSHYNGGKGIASDPVELSRITVWMTFGGCAAKRVQVSKMAQLVDLSPNLCIEDIKKSKQSQEM